MKAGKFIRLFLLVSSCSFAVFAQEAVDSAVNAKIRDEGLNRSKVVETFTHFTEDIGPRLTGTTQHKAAADWAREKMREWGLSDPHLESWLFGRGWVLDKFTIEMTSPRYMPLIGYPEAWSASTSGELSGTPVFLGDLTQAQLSEVKDKLQGRIVLGQAIPTSYEREDRPQPTLFDHPVAIGQPRPPAGNRTGLTQQDLLKLWKEGKPGVVLRPNRGEHGTLFVLGSDRGDDAFPSVILSSEHYNMIARMLQRGIDVRLRTNVQTHYLTDDKNSYNVIAEIPGTDPVLKNEVVMIGGHLDSWHSSTGATDNADGAAVVMEAMRILKAIGAKPKRTIRVALWSGEEEGLLGSKKYVEDHLKGDANKAARERLYVYLNIDPGTGPIYGWYMENNEAAKQVFDAWLEPFKDLGARKNILQGITNTDHLSFTKEGIPGFNPVQEYVNYDVRTHHTNVDTFERVKPEDLKQCAVVMASFAYHAAMREGRFPLAGK